MSEHQTPLIFEIAWEVCNQVGGIHTVIKSKAPAMLNRHGDNYFLIGPYNPNAALIEFEDGEAPLFLQPVLNRMAETGIRVHFGRWLIKGRPQVLLLDYGLRFWSLDRDKYTLWNDHGIPSPQNDHDTNNSIAFGFVLSDFFRLLTEELHGRPMLAHFHEWQTAVAIPRLRLMNLPVALVFTTHATILGRYMAADSPRFYEDLERTDPFATARHYNIETRYLIERCAAHGAHVFTTISDITAREAEKLLGRRPGHILPNGLNVDRFVALHEFQNLHLIYKERIHDFVMGHFFPSYTFDLDRTIYIFTSGRYEYRNKGMDVFIEALHHLNQELKGATQRIQVVAFIITRAPTRSLNVGTLQRQSMFEDLKSICTDLERAISRKVLLAASGGRIPNYDELLPHDFQVRLKRSIHARRSSALPAIVTHDMHDDANDAILSHLRHRNLFNAPSDPVKVVYHPDFLTATSPILNLDYDHFVRGCHLGVFPSYYEPWGYTPLECVALGIPAVTSDAAGFGEFALHNVPNLSSQGMYVLRRNGRSAEDVIADLSALLMRFTQLSRRERIELRNRAERLSDLFDWVKLACYYHAAHDFALQVAGLIPAPNESPT